MAFFDDEEIEDGVDEQIAKSGENRLDYYLLTSGTVTQWKDTAQKRFPNQWEMGPSMMHIGRFPIINNWLYVGEDCFEIEKSGEDDNEIRLVETTDIAWKELESSEKPSLRVSLAQITPKREYRIFTAVGKSCDFTGDSKVKFLGVFTIDYIECIYRNRMVLHNVSDELVF